MAAARRIVVDASVARSAGHNPVPGFVSSPCRAVLDAVLEARHWIALDEEGLREWKKHSSRYARGWLVRMFARRLALLLGDVRDEQLRERVRSCVTKPADRSALEKDCHLVEAALKADQIVISRDETVRNLFKGVCPRLEELKPILWANPEMQEEGTAEWVRAGAKLERARRLDAD
jgi:hypothetical protein